MKPKHDSLGRSSELKTRSHKNLYLILYQEEEASCLQQMNGKLTVVDPCS